MIYTYSLRLSPDMAYQSDKLEAYIAREKGIDARTIKAVRIVRRNIDARQRHIFVNLEVEVFVNEEPPTQWFEPIVYPDVSGKPAVIVVGAGPGGLFAALRLIELGCKPIVVERGKDVHARRKDIALISRTQQVDPNSNYAFGEGGAGAYSDGKLNTRSKKRGDTKKILRVFCQFGASTNILADSHPHIGTDRLPRVIENMRNQIIQSGGEVYFETRFDGFICQGDRIVGIHTANGKTFRGPVILATGHSARDVFTYLHDNHIEIEAKSIAVGVRLEHPSVLIDRLQYHSPMGRGRYLPAAEYSIVAQVEGRGVYSFCMCPGGFVVPAASGPNQLVVNGMSPSHRNSAWSNSGIVVETRVEDLAGELKPFMDSMKQDERFADTHSGAFEPDNPLQLMYMQEALEQICWQQAGFSQRAPSQRMTDFVSNRLSADLPSSSYAPGQIASPLHFWMPDFFTNRLQNAFIVFNKRQRGFLSKEAALLAIETRTSSPVRILRNRETYQHIRLEGLFPCGEGAGYAGGIISAAVDGEACADMAATYIAETPQA